MNLKKPIHTISPSRSDTGDVDPRFIVLRGFCTSENTSAVLLMLYGLLSVAAGMCLLFLTNPVWRSAFVPLLISGPIFIWIGLLLWRRMRTVSLALRKHDPTETIVDSYLISIRELLGLFRRMRNIGAIALLIGICGIVIACVAERMMYSAGLWLAIVIQTCLFSVAILLLTFRMEIREHELTRTHTPG